MAGWAKMWDISDTSRWFVSLRLIERGLWWELIRLCKKNGDTGALVVQNYQTFARLVNAEPRTVCKLVTKFQREGKVSLEISEEYDTPVMVIKVLDYVVYQQANSYKELRELLEKSSERSEKSQKNPALLAEQSRAEQSKALPKRKRSAGDPNLKPSIDYFCSSWEEVYKRKYVFVGGKHSAIVKRLLGAVGADKWKRVVDSYLADQTPFVVNAGHTLEVLSSRINLYTKEPEDPFAETERLFGGLRPDIPEAWKHE